MRKIGHGGAAGRADQSPLNFNITKSRNPASELPGALTSGAQFIKITMKLLLREV